MFADIFPPGVPGNGTTLFVVVNSITSLSTPALSEVNAASSIHIGPYLKIGNQFAPTHTQATKNDTRMSDTAARESFGRSTWASDALQLIFDPQGTDVAGNKAYAACVGSKFIAMRYGLATTVALAAAQKIDIYTVTFGNRHKLTPVEGDDSTHLVQVGLTLVRVAEDVALV